MRRLGYWTRTSIVLRPVSEGGTQGYSRFGLPFWETEQSDRSGLVELDLALGVHEAERPVEADGDIVGVCNNDKRADPRSGQRVLGCMADDSGSETPAAEVRVGLDALESCQSRVDGEQAGSGTKAALDEGADPVSVTGLAQTSVPCDPSLGEVSTIVVRWQPVAGEIQLKSLEPVVVTGQGADVGLRSCGRGHEPVCRQNRVDFGGHSERLALGGVAQLSAGAVHPEGLVLRVRELCREQCRPSGRVTRLRRRVEEEEVPPVKTGVRRGSHHKVCSVVGDYRPAQLQQHHICAEPK